MEMEALDEYGVWARCKIVSIRDGRPTVSFIGWGRKYDRECGEGEVRPVTHQVGGII